MTLSDVIDDQFLARYRALLDAEDAAFDELEHAFEDGNRAAFNDDLAAWRKAVEKTRSKCLLTSSAKASSSRFELNLARS